MLSELEEPIADSLTFTIRTSYVNFQFDNKVNYKNIGYIEIPAESRSTGEIHIIRALNPYSTIAKETPNLAKRAFLQEMLRLCTICPDAILIDTFDIEEKK